MADGGETQGEGDLKIKPIDDLDVDERKTSSPKRAPVTGRSGKPCSDADPEKASVLIKEGVFVFSFGLVEFAVLKMRSARKVFFFAFLSGIRLLGKRRRAV